MQYKYVSGSAEQTGKLAAMLADRLERGSVVALEGDLGAGKTTFSQAFALGLGVREIVSSPTFTIIKEYEDGRTPFYHMDVYRLSVDEADELGLDDYFYGGGITLVEWASRIAELLPQERLEIAIARADAEDADMRVIQVIPYGDRYRAICEELAEQGVWR